MDYKEMYRQKLGTVEGALAMLQDGDVLHHPVYSDAPMAFLRRLHTVAESLHNVRIWVTPGVELLPIYTDHEKYKGHIDMNVTFGGQEFRSAHDSGRAIYFPTHLHSMAETIMNGDMPTFSIAAVSTMNDDGTFCIPFEMETWKEIFPHVRKLVLEVNPKIPHINNPEAVVHIEDVDYIYESDEAMTCCPPVPTTETDRKIAEYVCSLIKDGDCIQLGIGGVPNMVGESLVDKHDLGIHTEMLTSSMGKLMKCGAVTNARKKIEPGKTVYTFCFGDQELYDYLDNNDNFALRRLRWVNDPAVIAQNDNVVSVNAAIQIDLTGQVCSESIGPRQFSGTGGATDFAYAAFHSKGGRGILAMPSTIKNDTISKIVPVLTPGSIVSIQRNIVDYIVTEYGIAPMKGRSVKQRVENLIAVAHPNFREDLRKEADRMMLW